jgi:flagellar hook assembly protein FlgD
MNEKIKIEYGTKLGFMAKAIVRIYDAQGRLVATPVNKNFNSPTGFENIMWDGRDSNMKRLEPGLYYCHAEISNRETSKRYSTVQPIVIKTRLK